MNHFWIAWLLSAFFKYNVKSHPHSLNVSTTTSTTLSSNENQNNEYTQITIIAAVMLLSFCVVLVSLIYFTVKLKYEMRVDEMEEKEKGKYRKKNSDSSKQQHLEINQKYTHHSVQSRSISALSPKSDKNVSSVSNREVSPIGIPIDLKVIDDGKPSDDIDPMKKEVDDAMDSDDENIPEEKQQYVHYIKENKEYKQVNRVNVPYVIEIEEAPKEELDGYDVDLYTTPIIVEQDKQKRKNTRKSVENSDKAKSPKAVKNDKIAHKMDEIAHKIDKIGHKIDKIDAKSQQNGKRDAKGKKYEWIRSTLQQVDAENHERYLHNFGRHQVTDDRLDDLCREDWKELIPLIGPRNAFRRLYETKKKKKEQPVVLDLEQMKSISEIDMNLSETASGSNSLERKGTSHRVTDDDDHAVYTALMTSIDEALAPGAFNDDAEIDEDDLKADVMD